MQDGTLLGLIRDGELIEWDHDTDTGCMIDAWTPGAREALERAGFRLKVTLGARQDGLQHRWVRDGEKTDIFFHYRDGDQQWHAAYHHKRQYRYHYPAFDLEALRVQDRVALAPSPPERFLETKYGPDWRTPKRRWHFATSPLNGRKT